jgi:basic amino acid/polyamine antiporter, APA family
VGGSYAYTRAAFGPLLGFLTGWALYIAGWISLPIFPLAFVIYLSFFLPQLSPLDSQLIKVLLITAITGVNLLGVRAGGRLNDLLTLAKLMSLALLIVLGLALSLLHPALAASHLLPFAPLGWSRFGASVVPIFWAYAGFEAAVLPASEIQQPQRTLPRGLILGMAIVILFYLLTSFAMVVALPWQVTAQASRPLTDAFGAILTRLGLPTCFGVVLMSLGGLVSIVGVYDVVTLSIARLSYAIATDELFPAAFARIHPKFGTPSSGDGGRSWGVRVAGKSWRQAAAYEAVLKRGEQRFERAARRRETWLLQALRRRSVVVPSSERLP